MSYFRRGFHSFEEFQREAFSEYDELGKDELEMLMEIEAQDELQELPPRRLSSRFG